MRELQLESLAALAQPLRGLRVLLIGLSGAGFPGGDGAREAAEALPKVGVEVEYSHARDTALGRVLAQRYDVAIVTNTRIGELLQLDRRLWTCGERTVLWFWDLRPGSTAAPLRGRVGHVFLSFNGCWLAPDGTVYDPADWASEFACPVGYAPQASPLREPAAMADAPRLVFVGDTANQTYHVGRADLCRMLGARVINARQRDKRLEIEASLPALYSSARYVLSTSPLAPGYTSVRTYSILACGGLMLLQRFPGCEDLFTDGEHAVLFDTADELDLKLARLDADAVERQRIAANGRRLHATQHTVAHRVLSICRQVLSC
ncbi:MAG TPA: glycosyltransferase [Polyangiaceae bacterium]|nr:glycosyltransferase [Polyangiaceae bacterium]